MYVIHEVEFFLLMKLMHRDKDNSIASQQIESGSGSFESTYRDKLNSISLEVLACM